MYLLSYRDRGEGEENRREIRQDVDGKILNQNEFSFLFFSLFFFFFLFFFLKAEGVDKMACRIRLSTLSLLTCTYVCSLR